MIPLCFSQSAFAMDNINENNIDEIYFDVYTNALSSTPDTITSEEDAYAYLISHIDELLREDDDSISFPTQNLDLKQEEKILYYHSLKS